MKTYYWLILFACIFEVLGKEPCKMWSLDDEFETDDTDINFRTLMDRLEKLTFKDYIEKITCKEEIREVKLMDYTSDVLWEKRFEYYQKYEPQMRDCQDCGKNPTIAEFRKCMARIRLFMIKDTSLTKAVEDEVKRLKDEEEKKCNN